MTIASDPIYRLLEAARALGADSADAVMFETVDVGMSQRLGKPEAIERSENKAIGLRAFIGQRQAMVSGSDISDAALSELAEHAVAMARATPADEFSTLAPAALYCGNVPDLDLFDASEPTSEWLHEQCAKAEEAALAVKGITNSEGADAGYSKSRVSLGIMQDGGIGFTHSYRSSYFSISVSVLAGKDTGMERDYEFTSARHCAKLKDAESIGKEAAERALKRLNPRKPATCQVPVVFDPRVSRSLLGVFAGSISGSAIARGSSFLKDDMGKSVFAANVSIIDDPHIKAGMGSKPFDAEGVKNGKRALVQNGVLQSWLLDMRTANKLGLVTTGNATRGVASPPSPSATNLYMEAGKHSVADLVGDIKNGFYVTETFGMGVNTVTGDYSQGAAGFWIENGQLAYPVSELTIAGHLRDMFKRATPASDLEFRYATNAPTLRVDGMTVAGA